MSNQIKIVPNLQPWEVMKRASDGEPLAFRMNESESFSGCYFKPSWNWGDVDYAIIDTTAPQIDWDKFDWKFFGHYGGLPVTAELCSSVIMKADSELVTKHACTLRESPFYYWPGGAQPVPGNVEVEIIGRSGAIHTDSAMELPWYHNGMSADIIAFRITGEIE